MEQDGSDGLTCLEEGKAAAVRHVTRLERSEFWETGETMLSNLKISSNTVGLFLNLKKRKDSQITKEGQKS